MVFSLGVRASGPPPALQDQAILSLREGNYHRSVGGPCPGLVGV